MFEGKSCDKCEKKFSTSSNLNRHVKQSHGDTMLRFNCPLCPNRGYARRSDLKGHYIATHKDLSTEDVDMLEPIEVAREPEDPEPNSDKGTSELPEEPPKKKPKVTTGSEVKAPHNATSKGASGGRKAPREAASNSASSGGKAPRLSTSTTHVAGGGTGVAGMHTYADPV